MNDNETPLDGAVPDDHDEYDDLLNNVMHDAAKKRPGYYHPIAPSFEEYLQSCKEGNSRRAIRKAWALLGQMIALGLYELPETDYFQDADKVKFVEHLHGVIMTLAAGLQNTYDEL